MMTYWERQEIIVKIQKKIKALLAVKNVPRKERNVDDDTVDYAIRMIETIERAFRCDPRPRKKEASS